MGQKFRSHPTISLPRWAESSARGAVLSSMVVGNGNDRFVGVESNTLGALCLAAVSAVTAATVVSCDDGELPVFASSSDPLIFDGGEDGPPDSDNTYAIPLPKKRFSHTELADLDRSVRAFGTTTGDATNERRGDKEERDEKLDGSTKSSKEGSPSGFLAGSNTPASHGKPDSDDQSSVTTQGTYFYRTHQIHSNKAEKFKLFAIPSSVDLGSDVAHLLGFNLHRLQIGNFADGESSVRIGESVRGKHVYVIASTTSTDAVMELLLVISAVRRASAKKISVVIPYFGYGRQDRKLKREQIAAADLTIMLEEVGVDHVMMLDLHENITRGFFPPKLPVDVSVRRTMRSARSVLWRMC